VLLPQATPHRRLKSDKSAQNSAWGRRVKLNVEAQGNGQRIEGTLFRELV